MTAPDTRRTLTLKSAERSQDLAPLHAEERPAETFMEVYWHFRLNKADALLVLRALGGRIRPDSGDAVRAKELGDYLTDLRAKSAEENLRGLLRAAEAMREGKEETEAGVQPVAK